ncbi:IS3 family transposase [Moraxella osloensis]|uniref:IS3 family transposase n=1 Tax=Faucicola osloensis TaxID=34062 RepID=UPI002002A683|nr:IS3 family transposase [Moraxella osloensis]MCK6053675.1 IS3 family transposase [Moraxella osloensis]
MPVGQRKGWAQQLQAQHNISIVVSCQIVGISRTAYYYEPKLNDDDAIVDKLTELTDKHTRWGLPMCYKRLRKLGYVCNHKRVYRKPPTIPY